MQNMDYRVSQGSILGPILINIYVNNVADYISDCLLVQYADDTQFLRTSAIDNLKFPMRHTESSILRLKLYFLADGFLMNPTKTRYIFIGNIQPLSHIATDIRIYFEGDNIYPSSHVQSLEVYMDRYMTFDVHASELKKVVGTLMCIYTRSLN